MKRNEKLEEKHRNQCISFIIVIILLVVIIGILSYLLYIYSPHKRTKNNPYDIYTKPNDNFVFLGDSITEMYPLEELYDNLPVINSGVSGYTTDNILSNIKEMVSIYNPTKVFLLIGTNDIEIDRDNEYIINNIFKITKEILKDRPTTKIYIQSVYPVNRSDNEKINHVMVGKRTNEAIMDLNKKIEKLCEKEHYTYIPVYDELLDENKNMALKYTLEGIHLTHLGYLKVTRTLYPYLES